MLKIGIIGVGVLGETMRKYYDINHYQVSCYDKYIDAYKTPESLAKVNEADIVFICGPTQRGIDNNLDTSIVEEMVSYMDGFYKIVVIRSTVTPGTTDYLQRKYPKFPIVFSPEVLTEKEAYTDFCFPKVQIVGYTPRSESVADVILGVLPKAPYFMRPVPALVAEYYKLYRNGYLLIQNVITNESYDLCVAAGINWNLIKEIAEHDPWIGRGHLNPIVDGDRGCNGRCIPKDSEGLQAWAESKGVRLRILGESIKSNSERLASQGIKKES